MNDDDKARLFEKIFNSTTFQNIQTDAAELVNVGVVDLGHEAHLDTCDFKFKKPFQQVPLIVIIHEYTKSSQGLPYYKSINNQ